MDSANALARTDTEYSLWSHCARRNFSGGIKGRPVREYIASNRSDMFGSASSALARMARNG
jgi:hypothetical protein